MTAVVEFVASVNQSENVLPATLASGRPFLSGRSVSGDIVGQGHSRVGSVETFSRNFVLPVEGSECDVWPGESASNQGSLFPVGEQCLQLCKELISLGFSHDHVVKLVGKCLDTESGMGAGATVGGDVSGAVGASDVGSALSGSSRGSLRRQEYRQRGEDMASVPGYCYLRLVRYARRAFVRDKLGVSPTLSLLFSLDESDLALGDLSKLWVTGEGNDYHVSREKLSGEARLFSAVMASTARAFPGVVPTCWVAGEPDGLPLPVTAKFGRVSGGLSRPPAESELQVAVLAEGTVNTEHVVMVEEEEEDMGHYDVCLYFPEEPRARPVLESDEESQKLNDVIARASWAECFPPVRVFKDAWAAVSPVGFASAIAGLRTMEWDEYVTNVDRTLPHVTMSSKDEVWLRDNLGVDPVSIGDYETLGEAEDVYLVLAVHVDGHYCSPLPFVNLLQQTRSVTVVALSGADEYVTRSAVRGCLLASVA